MSFRVFNTLSRSIEEFVPMDPLGKKVGMYCCGPTVHDFAHIGNFRTFVFSDLMRRFLEHKGYAVRHVMNVTDVEDKIIQRVRAREMTLKAYTSTYEDAFFTDLDCLGCLRPVHVPRATDYIVEIVHLIETLLARGMAYGVPDGSVYFSIQKYRDAGFRYGQLLNLDFDQLRPGARVASDEYGKESIADFALWKARVPEDGGVFWPSPWGEGRPGWHIECSAMSMQLLGPSFDLHLGGEDLVFPHHEDEIAQSEGAGGQSPGCRFVRYWMHGAHLLVEGKKMSKSLGNYFTLRDLIMKGFSGREIRFLLLSAHYRESFNFTLEGLHGARSALGRIDDCLTRLAELAGTATASAEDRLSSGIVPGVAAALDHDLNVSQAWAVVFEWVRECNRALTTNQVSPGIAAAALAAWRHVDEIFGLANGSPAPAAVSSELEALLAERQEARKAKDFKRSDAIRDALKVKGWLIEDTAAGPRLKKLG